MKNRMAFPGCHPGRFTTSWISGATLAVAKPVAFAVQAGGVQETMDDVRVRELRL